MKRQLFRLPSGRTVFSYDCIKYKHDPKAVLERCFEVCHTLVRNVDRLRYIEGCILLNGARRLHRAWVFDPEQDVCYEFSQLHIDTEFGERIPSDKATYYGCEFTREELQDVRLPILRNDEVRLISEHFPRKLE